MPDYSGTQINVPPTLEEAAGQIMGQAQAIEATLQGLRGRLADVQQYWGGLANTGWEELQARWDSAATNLMTTAGTLGDMATASKINWENYVETEGANAKSWAH